MNVQCPSCSTIFRVDPAKVPAGGVRARCSVCAAVFPRVGRRRVGRRAAGGRAPPPIRDGPAAAATARAGCRRRAGAAPGAARRPRAAAAHGDAGYPAPACRPAALIPPPAIPGAASRRSRGAGTTPLPQPAVGAAAPRGRRPRPVNPFLSQDPAPKARRLARALVSDMVVYHPAKRRDALKAGTSRTRSRKRSRRAGRSTSSRWAASSPTRRRTSPKR